MATPLLSEILTRYFFSRKHASGSDATGGVYWKQANAPPPRVRANQRRETRFKFEASPGLGEAAAAAATEAATTATAPLAADPPRDGAASHLGFCRGRERRGPVIL